MSSTTFHNLFFSLKRYYRIFRHRFEVAFRYRSVPAPYLQKHTLLLDFFPADAAIVETGTYLGETTKALSTNGRSVISLEPWPPLYQYNESRFKGHPNIRILNSSSEDGFDAIVSNLEGTVGFWLDGHFSGSGTHGTLSSASPIVSELNSVEKLLKKGKSKVYIVIDDARLFTGTCGYPSEDFIYTFALNNDLSCVKLRDMFFLNNNER